MSIIIFLAGFVIGVIFIGSFCNSCKDNVKSDNIVEDNKERKEIYSSLHPNKPLERYYCRRCGKDIGHYKSPSGLCDECFYWCYID